MKSLCIASTLILCVSLSTLPTSTASPVIVEDAPLYSTEMLAQIDTMPSDLRADLNTANAQVETYAATHTGPQTLAFAETLLNQMTENNLDFDYSVYDQEWGDPLEAYNPGAARDEQRRKCIVDHKEACRTEYNAEIFQSAAIGTGVFLGCGALTAGTGILGCAAGGLAVHALGIAAARQRRQACDLRAQYMCG